MTMIEIDGSTGESGGQILRTGLSLACLTQTPVRFTNIRQKRPKPGLQPQHLTCVKALQQITNAKITGAVIGSQTLEFIPGKIKSGEYFFDIGTAGSITLLVQCILPVLASVNVDAPSKVKFRGGTHVPFSPVAEYFSEIFLPTIALMGINASFKLNSTGWFPVGGGEAVLEITPSKFLPINLTRRKINQANVSIHSIYSQLPAKVGQRQLDAVHIAEAAKQLSERKALCPGCCVFIKADYRNCFAGFSSLGKKGKPAETVAKEALDAFNEFSQTTACIDPHLADQLLLYASLCKEETSFTTSELTDHFKTNAWTISKFLSAQIKTEKNREGCFDVTIKGK